MFTKESRYNSAITALSTKVRKNVREMPPPLKPDSFMYVFIGGLGSGKSNLYQNMILKPEFYRGQFHEIYIFNQNHHTLDKESLQLPRENFFGRLDSGIVENILNQSLEERWERILGPNTYQDSEQFAEEEKRRERLMKTEDIMTLFIMDDQGAQTWNTFDRVLTKRILSRRHDHTSWIWLFQQPTLCPKTFRALTDAFMLWVVSLAEEKEALSKLLSPFHKRTSFMEICNNVWKNDGTMHAFITIMCRPPGNDIRNMFFDRFNQITFTDEYWAKLSDEGIPRKRTTSDMLDSNEQNETHKRVKRDLSHLLH